MSVVALDILVCAPRDSLDTLARAVAGAQGADRLAPVTVVVPTNVVGVMTRRALGQESGILGVDMVTLNRLAELLAGPRLAHQQRQPVSTPLLELTVRQVLSEAPGSYAAVAHHPATVVALRELHEELRLAGPDGADRLATTTRGREAARVSRAVSRILQRRWYDEADLFEEAAQRLDDSTVDGLDRVILHLPSPFSTLGATFVRRLAERRAVSVVVAFTGHADADREQHRLLDQLDVSAPVLPSAPHAVPLRVMSTTDADDEVRIAVRTVVDAARGALTGTPVPLERIAVLWPTQRPYARLVEHHLTGDGIAWNGSGGIELVERIAPRLLLDLLDVDHHGLQRRTLFELLADLPVRDAAGRPLPTAEWERVSRRAGVSGDDDWIPRLAALAQHERWGTAASSLRDFIVALRRSLGHPAATRSWHEWRDWCEEQLTTWLGSRILAQLSDPEYAAWEALMRALERLTALDDVAEPVTRSAFRTVLENELADANIRNGRIGTGVTIGSLASAAGLVIDVAIIVGAAEGLMPPSPRSDPLLSGADRTRAGLDRPDVRANRLHHAFVATLASAHTVVTLPRGDLRTTTANQPSRWLDADAHTMLHPVDSAHAGLRALGFAPGERERRLRDRLRHTASGSTLAADHALVADDPVARRGLMLSDARRSDRLSAYDGDLTEVGVPTLASVADSGPSTTQPVSATQIQLWASCPHAYFVRYLLGVGPIDEPDRQISISALDRGLIQHAVLDALHHDVIDGRLPQPTTTGWTDEHRAALLHHFDEACATAELTGRTGRAATWASHRRMMRRDLLGWFAHDSDLIRSTGATILASEHVFPGAEPGAPTVELGLAGARRLAIKGSVDRLDRRRDGTLVVTDHKTGKADAYRRLSANDPTLDGTVFQLPAYATAARAFAPSGPSGRPEPAQRVRAEYSMFERGNYARFGIDFDDDVWARVDDRLGSIVDGIEAGWFPQLPARPGFSFYTECMFCDPDELGTTDVWERWSAKRVDDRIARWFGDEIDDDDDIDGHRSPSGRTTRDGEVLDA